MRPAKTQLSLGIRPVWSEAFLCAQWIAKDPVFLHADREDFDQIGRMPRLFWVFAGRTCHFVGFVVRRLMSSYFFICYAFPLNLHSPFSKSVLILLCFFGLNLGCLVLFRLFSCHEGNKRQWLWTIKDYKGQKWPPSEMVYFLILCSLHHTGYNIKTETVDGNQIWKNFDVESLPHQCISMTVMISIANIGKIIKSKN